MGTFVKEYDARIDVKKRITLRGAQYNYYRVQEFLDGKIVLEPRVLVAPHEISKKTLEMMDLAVTNIKNGNASAPVDLSAFSEK